MVKPVLIYADQGTSEVGVYSLLCAVPDKLQRPVYTVSAQDILAGELMQAALLIIPGGADLPYAEKLNGAGNRRIREFVAAGGAYVGICAGAYYGCRALDFVGDGYHIHGARELAFFPGVAEGSIAEFVHGRLYDETVHSKNFVPLHFADFAENPTAYYYHGGCRFLPDSPENAAQAGQNWRKIANYADSSAAVVAGQFGEGGYLLSGVHFELQRHCYQELVVDSPQEAALATHFSADYGAPLWQAIAHMINALE